MKDPFKDIGYTSEDITKVQDLRTQLTTKHLQDEFDNSLKTAEKVMNRLEKRGLMVDGRIVNAKKA